jgi:hypothetical protein
VVLHTQWIVTYFPGRVIRYRQKTLIETRVRSRFDRRAIGRFTAVENRVTIHKVFRLPTMSVPSWAV